MKLSIMPFEQPAGMFYITSMPASDLIRISVANPRKYDPETQQTTGWIQREKSMPRVKEIPPRFISLLNGAFHLSGIRFYNHAPPPSLRTATFADG